MRLRNITHLRGKRTQAGWFSACGRPEKTLQCDALRLTNHLEFVTCGGCRVTNQFKSGGTLPTRIVHLEGKHKGWTACGRAIAIEAVPFSALPKVSSSKFTTDKKFVTCRSCMSSGEYRSLS